MNVLLLLALPLLLFVYLWPSLRSRDYRVYPVSTLSAYAIFPYVESIRNFFFSTECISKGCSLFGNTLFCFPIAGRWVLVGKGQSFIRDICNQPEEILSMDRATEQLIHFNHVVGPSLTHEVDHMHAIKMDLNKNLKTIIPELIDEMLSSCEIEIGHIDDSWTPVNVFEAASRILCCMSNRVFVGPALCRNEDYIRLTAGFSDSAVFAGVLFKLVPTVFAPAVGKVVQQLLGHRRKMERFLQPLIEARKEKRENDMLSWMMGDQSPSNAALTMGILNTNFLAMHTTVKIFTYTLYFLAAEPAYQPLLLEEIQTHLSSGSPWTSSALARCVRLDSFFKESLRLCHLGALWLPRTTTQDVVFSDGTKVPRGTCMGIAIESVHRDPEVYDAPHEFRGMRFFKQDSQDQRKNRMTSPTPAYLAFGQGRHLCPGRFFAAIEVKVLMAHFLLNYEMKMTGVQRPKDSWIGPARGPNTAAEVLFRRRA